MIAILEQVWSKLLPLMPHITQDELNFIYNNIIKPVSPEVIKVLLELVQVVEQRLTQSNNG